MVDIPKWGSRTLIPLSFTLSPPSPPHHATTTPPAPPRPLTPPPPSSPPPIPSTSTHGSSLQSRRYQCPQHSPGIHYPPIHYTLPPPPIHFLQSTFQRPHRLPDMHSLSHPPSTTPLYHPSFFLIHSLPPPHLPPGPSHFASLRCPYCDAVLGHPHRRHHMHILLHPAGLISRLFFPSSLPY